MDTSARFVMEPICKPLEAFDIQSFAAQQTPWMNQTLAAVNDCVVRVGVLEGEFHWHKHDEEDEFFFVLEGRLDIEFETHKVELNPGQSVLVPKGAMHFPTAIGRTVVLMMEGSGVIPPGD